jgi:hypothetical protein
MSAHFKFWGSTVRGGNSFAGERAREQIAFFFFKVLRLCKVNQSKNRI